jgi:integration host factor subunit beta
VPSKNVVTFKPGKEMEELVRTMNPEHLRLVSYDDNADEEGDGPIGSGGSAGHPASRGSTEPEEA